MMTRPLRLMAVFAHPDDEALGLGGVLARCAAEGVETAVLTATRGDRGRFRGIRPGEDGHPGADALGALRERELRAAAEVLGVREVVALGYGDQQLDQVDAREIVPRIARELRRFRPQVVVTFGPDGVYGHPDHIAISQFAGAAIVAAAAPAPLGASGEDALPAHSVAKLYYMVWGVAPWKAYRRLYPKLVSNVDGIERDVPPWPDWMATTVVDTRPYWPVVRRAIACHESQSASYEALVDLPPGEHEAMWGSLHLYRAMSTVNGGRQLETDLFEGLRD